eukprot:TRINITY_DN12526_c0_g1_i2.p1 TRINITY_DN12526_c0_g1~~TRINITY_DN12526_c0_g1_i2.p1  ORF type:complete len:288 (+),score=71.00 TRINITY_DN12526_c0_g1_i2:273-1136(+)
MCGPQRSPASKPQAAPLQVDGELCSQDWAMFPLELLPRTLAAAGPLELCRLPLVCRSWQQGFHEARKDLEDFWQALCTELYPSMTAKILTAEAEAAAEAGLAEAGCMRSVENSWHYKFIVRHRKQLQWDQEKREQQLIKQQRLQKAQGQLIGEDKQRGQNAAKARRGQERGQTSAADSSTQRSTRSVRVRTCKRCNEKYLPGMNEADSCRWHRGTYIRVGSEGEADGVDFQRAAASEKKVQQLIKANMRKKKSKQTKSIVVDGEEWAWSCCGATNMVEPGCASGPHS